MKMMRANRIHYTHEKGRRISLVSPAFKEGDLRARFKSRFACVNWKAPGELGKPG
ncbi:hypothetical protein KEJ49_05030 [Candidatus Bathyarchaeota archaeon]|nr:hypothetical protein [Candidatus Bathyarchaeota archaeon]